MKKLSFFKKILYLLSEDAKKIPLLIIFVLMLSIIDLVGISMVGPYLSIILQPETLTQNYESLGFIFEKFESIESLVLFLGLLLIAVFAIKTLGGILLNRVILIFCYSQGLKLRTFLMSAYQNIPYEEFINRNSSEYIFNMQVLTEQYFKQILQSILRIGSESIVIILISILLIWTDPIAFFALFLLMSLSLLIYDLIFASKLTSYGKLSNENSVQLTRGIREGMSGIKEIRILEKENFFYDLLKKGAEGYRTANVKHQVIAAAPRYFLELIVISFIVLITAMNLFLGKDLNDLLPVLGMFGVASIRILPSINQIVGGLVQIRFGNNAIDILYEDFKKLADNPKYSASNTFRDHSESDFGSFDSIRMESVSFKYKNSESPTISNLSFSIQKGDSIGIVGASGAGKTTFIDVFLGLLQVESGEIFYNNKSILGRENIWMSKVAYIPQQVLLLDDSLASNITLTAHKAYIDEKKLMSAIKKARLNDLVNQLPDGVNTKLGDNGSRISGGQKQRVALARAFYHDREVLVMDESTSSLDKDTEKEIVDEIKRLQGIVTMIIISHNIATIEHCNKVYEIQKGGIKLL
jgi:ABC-type multidrug transport system fused ATPase/permease subunit